MWSAVRTFVVIGVIATFTLSSCSSSSNPPPPSATSSVPIPTVTTASPTPPPLPAPVRLRTGSASIRVTGSIREKLTLPIGPNATYQPVPGEFSITFVSKAGDALIVGGATPTRTESTSTTLTLSFILQAKQPRAFPSARGECRMTVTGAGTASIAARFRCRNLRAGGKAIDAAGTFHASR